MAEYSPNMGDLGSRAPIARGAVVNMIGAAVSLALVVGISVWGYKLVVRDVSGVPVVRAIEGPMRVQPDNPGGVAAQHQGLAVNSVAAEGIAERPAESLVLAPEPVSLSADDVATFASSTPNETDTVAVPASPEEQAILALADEIATQVAAQATGAAGTTGAEAPRDGLTRSIIPIPRPANLTNNRQNVATAGRLREVDPKTLKAGTILVQIGALKSEQEAVSDWSRISGRFDELFFDKGRVIVEAESVGRQIFRLRAEGFAEMSDARQFCAALMAEGADCIPVTVR